MDEYDARLIGVYTDGHEEEIGSMTDATVEDVLAAAEANVPGLFTRHADLIKVRIFTNGSINRPEPE